MAISLVGVAEGGAIDGGDCIIALPTSLENDLVLVMGGHGKNADAGVSTSGYTENLDTGTGQSISYKFMGVTPDTSVTGIGSADASYGTAYVVMVFRGVDTTTPIDATTTTATGFGAPDSPAITTVTDGAAVISFGMSTFLSDTIVTRPSGYDDQADTSGTDIISVTAMAAWALKATAGSENPAVWTNVTSSPWNAASIALRPILAASSGVFAATGSGVITVVGAGSVAQPFSMTGAGVVLWEGISLAENAALSISGSGVVSFQGGLVGIGDIGATGAGVASFVSLATSETPMSMTGTATVLFVSKRTAKLESITNSIGSGRATSMVNV